VTYPQLLGTDRRAVVKKISELKEYGVTDWAIVQKYEHVIKDTIKVLTYASYSCLYLSDFEEFIVYNGKSFSLPTRIIIYAKEYPMQTLIMSFQYDFGEKFDWRKQIPIRCSVVT